MKRLSIFPLLVAGISLGYGQETTYEITTTAIHRNKSETALPVTVLSNEELHAVASATIGDTLANQPGINNASFGPAVGQTVIRGQQGRRVMSMTNGIPNADASGNSADHAVTVEPILATSIEVLRGPSTLLYGGGAIGGVVNVIDKRIPQVLPENVALAFETRHDSASNLNTVVGRIDFKVGQFAWHMDGLKRDWDDLEIPGFAIDDKYADSDHEDEGEDHDDHEEEVVEGIIGNTGGETEAFTLGGSYVFNNGFIGLAFNQINNNYGLPAGTHEHDEDHDEDHEDEHDGDHEDEHDEDHEDEHEEENVLIDMQKTRYDLVGEWRNINSLFDLVSYRLSYTEYEHVEIEGPGIIGTRFNNDSWQQRVQVNHRAFNGLHGVFGWQLSHDTFGAIGDESFIPTTDINSNGIFVVEDFHTKDITVELGARVNWDELNPLHSLAPSKDFTSYSYSATALWDISSPVSLGLALSHSERAPSVEELYSNFSLAGLSSCVIHLATASCEVGNVNFNKEVSDNVDLSVYLDYGILSATVTSFYNSFDDYIFQENTGIEVEGFALRSYGQGGAKFTGVEIDMNLELNSMFNLRLFGDITRGRLQGNGDAPRMPPQRLGGQLNFEVGQWSSFVSVLAASKQNHPGANEISTQGYTRVDIGADYTYTTKGNGEFLVYAKGRNIGNEEIRLSTSYLRGFAPEAGRSLEVGIRYQY